MKKIYSLVAIFTFIVILTPSSLSYGSFIKVNKNGFGPCLINGVVGNGNLTVGLDKKGTIVLFSWPKASYYDHVDYLALSDKQPNYGVKDNMGLFTGIIFQKDNIRDISWLKSEDWNHTQYYLNDDSNILITESVNEKLKLKVINTCFVLPDKDVLIENFEIELQEGCNLKNISLIFFENYNICDYRINGLPVSDWLLDFLNDYRVYYDSEIDGICHYKIDTPLINKLLRNKYDKGIYITISGSAKPLSYQCGNELRRRGKLQDAYLDSLDTILSMNNDAFGMVDSAMVFPLSFKQNIANTTLHLSVNSYKNKSIDVLKNVKQISFREHLVDTDNWWKNWLSHANLPLNAPDKILRIAKRSLLLIRLGYDNDTGSIIASPSRQAPYSLDWPRDGSFLNYALDLAGYYDMVEKHNRFYTKVQRPSGRYAMCYYTDGLLGGPIPFEIDQLGFVSWTFLEHYKFTKNTSYLKEVYPSIKKMAGIATIWRDPITKLQLPANEDDDWRLKQKLRGAASVLLTLKCAIEAGNILGENKITINLWESRAEELRCAIDKYFWRNNTYGDPEGGGSTIVWPLEFKNLGGNMSKHLDSLYDFLHRVNHEGDDEYGYEIKTIASLAYVWRNDSRIKELLDWFCNVPTEGTLLMGERFKIDRTRDKIEFENYVSLPHLWTHALFYIAAMFTYS